MHPRKNSVSGSWVVASEEATLCEGVCAAASWSRVRDGSRTRQAGFSMCQWWAGADASKTELRERELGGGFSRGSAVEKSAQLRPEVGWERG